MELRIERVSALPGTLVASTMYIVTSAVNGQAEVYFTGSDSAVVKHTIKSSEVQQMINDSIASFTNIDVVADIAARDALAPTRNIVALVMNATGDTTVTSGAAMYLFSTATSAWIKVSEYESLDLTLLWENVVNRPTSTVADIDSAVAQRHSHGNAATLNELTTAGNQLMFNGAGINANLSKADW